MKNYIIIIILAIFTSCGNDTKENQLNKLKQQRAEIDEKIKNLEAELATKEGGTNKKVKAVAITTLSHQPFVHYIEVQGKVDSDENVTISAKTGGAVSRILVDEGQEVRVGQVLAELDNQMIMQGMEELKSGLAFATTMYEKQKNLWDQKIGTEVQFLSAKNNKESLEKKMATLQEQLEMTKLKSPINGVIDGIDIKIGQTIMPGIPAIRVVNPANLKAKAEVAEAYASKVRKGNEVRVFFPDLNKEEKSTISYSAKVINNNTRTFMVESPLEQNQDYHPNMITVLKIVDYKNETAIVVPINAIQQVDGKEFVYVAAKEGNQLIAKKKIVKVGSTYGGNAEVLSGLNAGDQLVIAGYDNLNEGDPVKL